MGVIPSEQSLFSPRQDNTFLLRTNNQCIEIHSNSFIVYSRQHMISLNAMTMPKQLPRVGVSNGSRMAILDAGTTAVVEYYVDPIVFFRIQSVVLTSS